MSDILALIEAERQIERMAVMDIKKALQNCIPYLEIRKKYALDYEKSKFSDDSENIQKSLLLLIDDCNQQIFNIINLPYKMKR